jgi:hypothetical protein
MHFIGRAMVAKGWLSPEALPPADSLRVELAGPARDILFPGTVHADSGAKTPKSAKPLNSSTEIRFGLTRTFRFAVEMGGPDASATGYLIVGDPH